jgi:hypothetical protein
MNELELEVKSKEKNNETLGKKMKELMEEN